MRCQSPGAERLGTRRAEHLRPDPERLAPLLRIIQNVTAQREGIDAGILELDPLFLDFISERIGDKFTDLQTVTAFDVTGYSSAKSPGESPRAAPFFSSSKRRCQQAKHEQEVFVPLCYYNNP